VRGSGEPMRGPGHSFAGSAHALPGTDEGVVGAHERVMGNHKGVMGAYERAIGTDEGVVGAHKGVVGNHKGPRIGRRARRPKDCSIRVYGDFVAVFAAGKRILRFRTFEHLSLLTASSIATRRVQRPVGVSFIRGAERGANERTGGVLSTISPGTQRGEP
jgi:hypothetical protein